VVVRAWQAHDTGLVAVLPRFRRLAGRVRHHAGTGPAWPAQVDLAVEGDHLVVVDVGRWPVASVSLRLVSEGPPVAFVLDLGDDGSVLLNAAAGPDTAALLEALQTD
jgi:hypothetical protein